MRLSCPKAAINTRITDSGSYLNNNLKMVLRMVIYIEIEPENPEKDG